MFNLEIEIRINSVFNNYFLYISILEIEISIYWMQNFYF